MSNAPTAIPNQIICAAKQRNNIIWLLGAHDTTHTGADPGQGVVGSVGKNWNDRRAYPHDLCAVHRAWGCQTRHRASNIKGVKKWDMIS